MTGATLVTGADGYLGRSVVGRLLETTDDRLVLALRAADRAELSSKTAAMASVVGAQRERMQYAAADVREDECLSGVEPGSIRRIVHAAAVTRFNVEEDVAREVNAEGAERVLRFAATCPDLERVVLLSTIYSAGLARGDIAEVAHGGTDFANFYEWSKWDAERRALNEFAGLPVTIARVATVIADDDDGAVVQYNVFHNTLRLLYYGMLSVLPGEGSVPVYLTTGEFVTDAVTHLLDPAVPLGIYHVCHEPERTASLGELVDLAYGVFQAQPDFVRRRILRPLFCDVDAFMDLVDGVKGLSGSPMNEAVGSVAPFARQLYVHKQVRNDRLREVWPGYRAPDPHALVVRTCERLVDTRWGRTERRAG